MGEVIKLYETGIEKLTGKLYEMAEEGYLKSIIVVGVNEDGDSISGYSNVDQYQMKAALMDFFLEHIVRGFIEANYTTPGDR
jgi:hypothetical protein